MAEQMISIKDAARAIPCDHETLRTWLQEGHITGRDSFGRRDRQITDHSTGIVITVDSLQRYCAEIGVKANFDRK